jgi:hypothetical protein
MIKHINIFLELKTKKIDYSEIKNIFTVEKTTEELLKIIH